MQVCKLPDMTYGQARAKLRSYAGTLHYRLSQKEVDQLTGNLPELTKWQQSFLKQIEDCSK